MAAIDFVRTLVVDVLDIRTRTEANQPETRTTNETEKKHTQLLLAITTFMALVERRAEREPDDRIKMVLDELLNSDIAGNLRTCLDKCLDKEE